MRAWTWVVLASLSLSGCGTAVAATSTTSANSAPSAHAPANTERQRPAAGSRTEAIALARRLIERLPLPPGTVPAGKRPVPEGMRDLPGVPGNDWVILTRLLAAPGQPDKLSAYLRQHHPRGANVTTGSSSLFGETTLDVTFDVPAPSGIATAEIGFQMQRLTGSTSLIYAYALVVWYPPRSKAEHLSAGAFRSVTVSVNLNNSGAQGRHVSRTFTQRSVIAKLAAVIDGRPAAPYYAVPCPLFSTYSLSFHPARQRGAAVTVASLSCVAASVTVGGAGQPPLWDSPPRLGPLAFQVLGLTAQAPPPAGPAATSRPMATSAPVPGSRAEAAAYGRHLLSLAILPPGTRLAGKSQQVPAEASGPVAGRELVRLSKPQVAPGTPAQVRAYVLAHAPKGWDKGWGQEGAPGAPSEWDAFFQLQTPRAGLYFAQLETTIVPAAKNTSLINESADVIWFPPRGPAEDKLNPVGYRSVTITANGERTQTRTFGGLTATRLLMFLGGLQAAPDDAPVSCPLRVVSFTLDFRPATSPVTSPATRQAPPVRVMTAGCWADHIWIGNVSQPSFWDTSALYGMASQLLGVKN